MSEGVQITIPDFEDDDYGGSSTIPFGRGAGAFGFGNSGFGSGGGSFGGSGAAAGSSSSGQDSPTLTTPVADRSFFSTHTRGDSVTSVESGNSFTTPSRNLSRAHTAQPSIAVVTKKSSFASIRNAFTKSAKTSVNEPTPPMPQLDFTAPSYVLKTPFNRSATSLNSFSRGIPAVTSPRPSTPSRATPSTFKSSIRGHSHAKSYHSQSGASLFEGSDGHSNSPPPVPRMPRRSETPDYYFEDEKVILDPKTPSEYALHAVFIRFATTTESKIDAFLRQSLDQDPLLPRYMGPGVDTKFDDILGSLGKIGQKHTKPVVDSIMRWRRDQLENVGSDVIHHHMSRSPTAPTRAVRNTDVPGLLNERKSLASIYIMCRALIAILKEVPKDALTEAMGHSLEKTTFDQFRKPDLKLLVQSENHRINAELYSTLLGHLANIRFVSVTDRFLSELGPVAQGQVPKDQAMKYENLVKGLHHIRIKVWPSEAFEDGAEFLESLSKSFANAHGLRLKTAFAEAIVQLLHPVGKTIQAEANNPLWTKAIDMIYPKAREMMAKPRYWSVAFPLVITTLCVAPDVLFKKHWLSTFEASLPKLKEKAYRLPVMNGLLRLLWMYLYRCQESASTTCSKLETLMKHFFPSNRLSVYPADEHLEPFIIITHLILSRHFEHGKELCLELMQEHSVQTAQQSGGNVLNVVAQERTSIAVQAILLSLSVVERESHAPTWPSDADFTVPPSFDDYPMSSEFPPQNLLAKPALRDLFDRCGTTLSIIARACNESVGSMSMFDEQWAYSRLLHGGYEDLQQNYVVRRHPEAGALTYPGVLAPQINLLRTCFQAWPRCLHSSLPIGEAIDMLLRGIIHVEPSLGDVSRVALKRFMNEATYSLVVLSRFNAFLFGPKPQEGTGVKLLVESDHLLTMWLNVAELWIGSLLKRTPESVAEDEDVIMPKCLEIEAGALFLLSHKSRDVHSIGVTTIRQLGLLVDHLSGVTLVPGNKLQAVEILHGSTSAVSYLEGYDELLEKTELARLHQWKESKRKDVLLRISDSTHHDDREIWKHVLPLVMQAIPESPSLLKAREILVISASRLHPTISHLAGLSGRAPASLSASRGLMLNDGAKLVQEHKDWIEQWALWVKVLSSTATLPDASRPALTQLGRDHSRAQSDASFERERLTSTRGLFRYLTPFLDSEYPIFRDAAVLCISSFPCPAYPYLLDDLSLLAGRQFYDDPRAKQLPSMLAEQNMAVVSSRPLHDERSKVLMPMAGGDRGRRQERLHSAVARIYYLTSHNLQYQRSAAKQSTLSNVLKFVRTTQSFLASTESRDNFSLQRLRRYFCGTVEKLFEGLATLNDSDRFIPPNTHLTLYRLCEEWCLSSPRSEASKQRFIVMQRQASVQNDNGESAEHFRVESELLSHAAVGAVAAVCTKAYAPPIESSGSPTERQPPEFMRPITTSGVLDRLAGFLASPNTTSNVKGRKALISLLTLNVGDKMLIDECLRRSVVMSDSDDSSISPFFEVISDLVCAQEAHGFNFAQIVCLGLSNLCHPKRTTRRQAFNMLNAIHQQSSGILVMSQFEAGISSMATGTYFHAYRAISDFLAGEHPLQATAMLNQIATWLPQFHDTPTFSTVNLLMLQSLELWIPNIILMSDGKPDMSYEGHASLYHLLTLSLRYGVTHSEQVSGLWTKLLEPPNQSNGHATVRFLLEQSHKVGSTFFVNVAANVVACFTQTSIGSRIFEELCSVIEPARMLPTIDHKLHFPDEHDMNLWADLDALFADGKPKLSLGSAQFAWLFLSDVALQQYWHQQAQLPLLLHVLLAHLDHRTTFVRKRARRMLFIILRSWALGYDELTDGTMRAKTATTLVGNEFEERAEKIFWSDDEKDPAEGMQWLCSEILSFLEPLCPGLREKWGSLALSWGTTCSIRAIAFRSLQIFRALNPRTRKSDLALLLGRMSNTVAAPDENIQSFSAELIATVQAIASSPNLDPTVLPQIYWTACACMSTPVESEFVSVLDLLGSILPLIDFNDSDIVDSIMSLRPIEWKGDATLQSALMIGLRSSTASLRTMKLLQELATIQDARPIDQTASRLRDLFTAALPWCLNATEPVEESLCVLAENIAAMAKEERRPSIAKIMISFAKGRFRTKDDFLREAVSSLREHYGAQNWAPIVTLLMGFILNDTRWLRVQSMQIVKLLFQQREARNPVELLGSELLMPLLRLLDTDLAEQALDVLEEPMAMSGGLPAKQVLRMSMSLDAIAADCNPTVFGIPNESGWCVAQADDLRATCRANVMAVFDTCSLSTRPSQIEFEPEVEALARDLPTRSMTEDDDHDLGGLVQNLHDLSTFFQEDEGAGASRLQRPTPSHSNNKMRRLEARVAAILAKSTSSSVTIPDSDIPPTPFVDAFRVGPDSEDDPEDGYESHNSDSEVDDAFIFDSPMALYRPSSNGYH